MTETKPAESTGEGGKPYTHVCPYCRKKFVCRKDAILHIRDRHYSQYADHKVFDWD